MREIKFRAWDEKEKCWVSGFAIHQSGMFSDWAGCKNVNGVCVADANWEWPKNIPHVKIMQYTGLKDKNGREIYEGDVLGRVSPHTGLKHSYTVEWDEKHARFMSCGKRFQEHISASIERGCEVIGNIYENPELLKGEETT